MNSLSARSDLLRIATREDLLHHQLEAVASVRRSLPDVYRIVTTSSNLNLMERFDALVEAKAYTDSQRSAALHSLNHALALLTVYGGIQWLLQNFNCAPYQRSSVLPVSVDIGPQYEIRAMNEKLIGEIRIVTEKPNSTETCRHRDTDCVDYCFLYLPGIPSTHTEGFGKLEFVFLADEVVLHASASVTILDVLHSELSEAPTPDNQVI
ncbi:MAG: hypothetical protein AAGG48_30885 [Planctomycetota bacterium]